MGVPDVVSRSLPPGTFRRRFAAKGSSGTGGGAPKPNLDLAMHKARIAELEALVKRTTEHMGALERENQVLRIRDARLSYLLMGFSGLGLDRGIEWREWYPDITKVWESVTSQEDTSSIIERYRVVSRWMRSQLDSLPKKLDAEPTESAPDVFDTPQVNRRRMLD